MILSALISSLSETILAYVVKCLTSRDVWVTLERMFTAHSRARSMNIHYQLATLKKGNSSVADYFHKFTHLTDTFAAVEQPLPHHEALSFLLAGLGSDYNSLITFVKTQVQPMTLEDLYGHMLSHELRLAQNQPTVDLSNVSANFTNKGPSNRGGRGGRHSSNFSSNRGGRSSSYNQRGRGHGRQTYSYPSNRPVCQMCQKPGHAALQCYHHFDNSYTFESTPQMQALFATPNHSQDPNWYPDSGATHHLTHDLTNLNIRADEYQGSDQIRVASGHLYISRDVLFQESIFPFHQSTSSSSTLGSHNSPPSILGLPPSLPLPMLTHGLFNSRLAHAQSNTSPQAQSTISRAPNTLPTQPSSTSPNTTPGSPPVSNNFLGPSPDPPNETPGSPSSHTSPESPNSPQISTANPNPPNPTYHMLTRSKNLIFKPKIPTDGTTRYPLPKALLVATASASSLPEPTCFTTASKDPNWRNAMNVEFDALLKNQIWSLVPPSPNQNIVGCKWVFRIKRNADGSIERYKARLVAKRFHQQPGVDYDETYSPVIKPTTAIYGLKQAPQAWFSRLSNRLLALGFHSSKSDSSLFICHTNTVKIYVLIYVVDIIITSSSSVAIDQLLSSLQADFAVKDLGSLKFFFGVEVIPTTNGVLLSQQRYIKDILTRTKMLKAKPVTTPMASSTSLSAYEGEPFPDHTLFRSAVGALQYLSITRPDIAFCVNKLSQFMHKPTLTHWQSVKRLLRYLKHTIQYVLHIYRSSCHRLQAFSDADLAGNRDDRRSTGSFCVFLGKNLISWSCHKQATVARSSTEAEYKALANTAAELNTNQLVDLLTKPISSNRFLQLRTKLNVLSIPLGLRGRVKDKDRDSPRLDEIKEESPLETNTPAAT
uniref:Reverse transcriptase Ty1/copia-type domain-containing protein n=2 Tax=Fagus sylvatica TaxID=28930 RepID=A0A2N9I0S6_FAGSY